MDQLFAIFSVTGVMMVAVFLYQAGKWFFNDWLWVTKEKWDREVQDRKSAEIDSYRLTEVNKHLCQQIADLQSGEEVAKLRLELIDAQKRLGLIRDVIEGKDVVSNNIRVAGVNVLEAQRAQMSAQVTSTGYCGGKYDGLNRLMGGKFSGI